MLGADLVRERGSGARLGGVPEPRNSGGGVCTPPSGALPAGSWLRFLFAFDVCFTVRGGTASGACGGIPKEHDTGAFPFPWMDGI